MTRPIHWWGRLGADASEELPHRCDGVDHKWVRQLGRLHLCADPHCDEVGYEVPA